MEEAIAREGIVDVGRSESDITKGTESGAGGGVGYVYSLAVHADGERGGTHLFRDWRGLHARGCVGCDRKREKSYKEPTKDRQEDEPLQQSRTKTTLALGVLRSGDYCLNWSHRIPRGLSLKAPISWARQRVLGKMATFRGRTEFRRTYPNSAGLTVVTTW